MFKVKPLDFIETATGWEASSIFGDIHIFCISEETAEYGFGGPLLIPHKGFKTIRDAVEGAQAFYAEKLLPLIEEEPQRTRFKTTLLIGEEEKLIGYYRTIEEAESCGMTYLNKHLPTEGFSLLKIVEIRAIPFDTVIGEY